MRSGAEASMRENAASPLGSSATKRSRRNASDSGSDNSAPAATSSRRLTSQTMPIPATRSSGSSGSASRESATWWSPFCEGASSVPAGPEHM